jgi:ElaB/YqjD/DUF883 family membrane-anchored ribosome-binding protein
MKPATIKFRGMVLTTLMHTQGKAAEKMHNMTPDMHNMTPDMHRMMKAHTADAGGQSNDATMHKHTPDMHSMTPDMHSMMNAHAADADDATNNIQHGVHTFLNNACNMLLGPNGVIKQVGDKWCAAPCHGMVDCAAHKLLCPNGQFKEIDNLCQTPFFQQEINKLAASSAQYLEHHVL